MEKRLPAVAAEYWTELANIARKYLVQLPSFLLLFYMSAVEWARRARWLLAKKEELLIEINNCEHLLGILREKLINEYGLPKFSTIETVLNRHDFARLKEGDNITGF